MKVWRIAAETRHCRAEDLSGAGAAKHPGRWNKDGEAVVYAAESVALAVLETAAHVDPAGLPLNRFLVAIEIPDDVWLKRQSRSVAQLPPTWLAIPAGQASIDVGSAWLASVSAAILQIPSVIAPEENLVLLNPKHPDVVRIQASVVRPFEYDRLFRA
jgi:RES domain-containing protein